MDQCQYLSGCAPTPPLTQQQSTDNKVGLMLSLPGRDRCAVSQILTCQRLSIAFCLSSANCLSLAKRVAQLVSNGVVPVSNLKTHF